MRRRDKIARRNIFAAIKRYMNPDNDILCLGRVGGLHDKGYPSFRTAGIRHAFEAGHTDALRRSVYPAHIFKIYIRCRTRERVRIGADDDIACDLHNVSR